MRDVIVVGAGGGGPVVAKELAAKGLDVLLLEGGPRHADLDEDWSHYENDANNPLTGFLRFGPADRSKPAWYRETPQNSFLWQLSGVGGTTQHYFGNSPRAYPGSFAGYDGPDKDAYDTGHLFPFSYSELVPYYEWAEATLPVQTAPMGTKEEVFFRGCENLDLPVQTGKTTTRNSFRPQENAVLQPGGFAGKVAGGDEEPRLLHPQATGCTMCGYCIMGCRHPEQAPRNLTAKRSTDNSYIPMALTADRWASGGKPVELVTDAFVTQVHTEQRNGRTTATGVTWRVGATGEKHREDAKVVVLAGGCTENPRLWLNSGLPNPNDWVGRGYTDHYFDWVFATFDSYTGTSKGTGSSARTDWPGRGGMMNVGIPPALFSFTMAMSDSGIRGQYTNGRGPTGTWDGPAGRPMGNELKDLMMHGVDQVFAMLIMTDDHVEAQNRTSLSTLPADEHGAVAKVEINQRQRTRRTVENREFLVRRAVEVARAAGAKKVYRMDWAPIILHVQSSMRMGESEANSVLDPNGQARWVDGLYIADNSALANSASGANPTLTTQAVSTRTAERIFTDRFGGDPWVRTGAPVVSTDPRITAGMMALGL
ncbi:GMC family oxidoreductase N-terminal domain-containing protein [Prauserella alba]|uniref:Choline dehydrogenase n=1 Tax=Prauserella alba TaxID=176898 RepID=A0ABN1VMW8_9PSEU|nr:GMC family oxidoreductase N-terminal domain-containing protein [Prauserella alba]MCP2181959.1 Choline dehydrogenase [Prauserella alba]